MSSEVSTSYKTRLEQQNSKAWSMLSEEIQEKFALLPASNLQHFKVAIGLSDYVLRSVQQSPDTVYQQFINQTPYQATIPNYQHQLTLLANDCETEDKLHQVLRQYRMQEMVNIAVADMVLNVSIDFSLQKLSDLADALILTALNWLTQFCEQKWGVPTSVDGVRQQLLVFGMGKLGGKELNFSSDIDLIFVYPESGETQGVRRTIDNQLFFTRLAQKLITSLHQKTADGFVYRVDMRLRPFGESGPLVMTSSAFEDYYQEQGRDWERYAMLKARLIGDSCFHKEITQLLKPFVYRRYIDFSVIDSLRRMKMMIAQEVRRKQLNNNIKLGAGGIREIEFVVQVFQLIRGGRLEKIRERNLLTVLPALVDEDIISSQSKKVLKNAYLFLRRVENIIQAIDDKQTQTLPELPLDRARIIGALHQENIQSWSEFEHVLSSHLQGVHQEFIQLIGEENPNQQDPDQYWVTLWDSQWTDEESIQFIERQFELVDAEQFWQVITEFRYQCGNRSIGQRGRQVLDKLMPLIFSHIQLQPTPSKTLQQVLVVISQVLTRTAYLELLFENEGALKHLITLCDSSSWLTEHIAKYPILLDELIDPTLLNNPPALSDYKKELREVMLRIPEDDLELQMETLRQFKQSRQLKIAASDLANVLPLMKVSDHLTALAEAVVDEVIHIAWHQMNERFGIPQSLVGTQSYGFGVIGYGKTGGIELGYASDLDLVFLHNCDIKEPTTGKKSVSAGQFYIKLAQRIMHIFNTKMSSGILYELDLRLRPSGNSGLLVVHINTFEHYLENDAWTWELQALVRARCIYGDANLSKMFMSIRSNILSASRNYQTLHDDVNKMRDKMRDNLDKSTPDLVDIKQGSGGLVDIEFLAQYLVLRHCAEFTNITKFSDNIRIFEQLHLAKIITEEEAEILSHRYCQLRDFGHRATLQNSHQLLTLQAFNEGELNTTRVIKRLFSRE